MRPLRLSRLALMMLVVAEIALLLALYRETRRRRHLADAEWYAAKAGEARAAAIEQEKSGGSLVMARVFRDMAEKYQRQGERERATSW